MEQTCQNHDFDLHLMGEEILKKKTDNAIKANKYNQCDFASSQVGKLRRHLKMHSGVKSNKCNQCDYTSYQAGDLRTHLKTHNREKLT